MERILSEIKTLPALPAIVYQLTRLIDNPNSTAQDLAGLISKDQALTARVLRLVNSSYYAFRSRISKVSHAISLLGFIAIKNIVLGLSIIETFNRKDGDEGLDNERFWEHSIGAATAARALAESSGYTSPEEAFVAGLLHDIGKVIFDMVVPHDYGNALMEAARRKMTILAVENEYFGYAHPDVGMELAKMWALPEQLQSAIRNHHEEEPEDALAVIVRVADTLCKAARVGYSGDSLLPRICDRIWRRLDIPKDRLSRIFSGLKKEVLGTRIFLGMASKDKSPTEFPEEGGMRAASSCSVLIATGNPKATSLPQLILEEENFIVRLSGIPIHMTRDEKREVDLILIDEADEPGEYPKEVQIRLGEAATRSVPVMRVGSPLDAEELIDLVKKQFTEQPA